MRYGHKKSCGCLAFETKYVPPLKDRCGLRYGRLVVLWQAGYVGRSRKKQVAWSCRCDCGAEVVVAGTNLESGSTQSCGCRARDAAVASARANFTERIKRNTRPSGHSSRLALFHGYRRHAKNRNLPFELDFQAFVALTQENCAYCGAAPSGEYRGSKRSNGVYVYNGVDRSDSSMGYVAGNVVACCRQCNWSKRDLSRLEFLIWVQRVYSHQRGAGHAERVS